MIAILVWEFLVGQCPLMPHPAAAQQQENGFLQKEHLFLNCPNFPVVTISEVNGSHAHAQLTLPELYANINMSNTIIQRLHRGKKRGIEF